MKARDILELYDSETRLGCRSWSPDIHVEVRSGLVRFFGPLGSDAGDNGVVYARSSPKDADALVAEQVEFYGARASAFEWKLFSHDSPADLSARLTARGFERGESEALMVLELARPPAEQPTPNPAAPAQSGFDMRRIHDANQLEDLFRVQIAAGQDDAWLRRSLIEELESSPSTRVYVSYAGAEPVSAGWLRYAPGAAFASLWGGTTVPTFRRRGLYSALVHLRAREARAQGARFLTVDALPTSRPILETLGFQQLTATTPYVWSPRD